VAVLALVAVAAGTWALFLRRQTPPPARGVPLSLAAKRAQRISDVTYALHLRVPASRQAAVTGQLTARFTLSDRSSPLAFDFAESSDHLSAVVANGETVTPRVENGHILIPSQRLIAGTNVIDFSFQSGDAALNRSDDFLYSLFVPAKASTVFPCFDQPDLKARWQFSLDVPPGWVAVSNARASGHASTGSQVGYLFDETPPLPSYLFAFAAGHFTIETAERDGRVFRMFHRENDPARIARNRDAIFDLHAHALAWLEAYTGIPYPFGKFDFVLIPSFQFSGMEHPGAIFYNASSLLLEATATQNQALTRANTIAHETAHMWFGDLVTMKWFDDVWMKEVFANFMAAKIVNPMFPDVNHDLRFLLQNYPTAYEVDRTPGANPIRQPLGNLNEAGSLYGAIIYQKAPIVMRQLELTIGPDVFQSGLRAYLTAHAFGNATWPDLVAELDRRTPLDLAAWSHAWVEEAGRPAIRTNLEVQDGRVVRLAFEQSDPRGRGLVWPQRLRVLIGTGSAVQDIQIRLDEAEVDVPEAAGRPAPTWVLPVGGGLGYGLFRLDSRTLDFLTSSIETIPNPLTRGAALVALWEAMLEGDVPPSRVFQTALVALRREPDELNLQHWLADVQTLFWRFTSPDERPAAAAALEPVLREGLARASSRSRKAAWFAALQAVATTDASVQWLDRLWARQTAIEGLPLSEVDEADLAAGLAVRDVPNAGAILTAQLGRFTNADRRARFQFIMPALSSDAAVRASWFESLRDVRNRAHEAWVIDGERYLHHPLRAAVSRRLVVPALELLPELRRTGDIFFPKRWADATLAGYQSVQTAADVRDFIQHLPASYPRRLEWVLQSAADPLLRAAKFQQ
jgi:aminopeptidase N